MVNFNLKNTKTTVDIAMKSNELSLSDLDAHIDLIIELMSNVKDRASHSNFIGRGIEAYAFKILDGLVLKMYSEEEGYSTLKVYDLLEESDCEILAKNYAVLQSYSLINGIEYTFIIQEELQPLKEFKYGNSIYKNKKLIIDFLKEVYEFSDYTSLNDAHSGNVGLTIDGKLKLLDCGLCSDMESKKINLEYTLYDLSLYNWFKTFITNDILEYSGIHENNFDPEEKYEKLIFALEGLS